MIEQRARAAPALYVPQSYARPMAPADVQEAVQQWGRSVGRTARLRWVPRMQPLHTKDGVIWIDTRFECWAVELELPPHHPSLRAWREGKLEEEPTESVLLMTWDEEQQRYVPMDLEQYGPSGVVEFLEAGNTWSRRGRFDSMAEACRYASRTRQEAVRKAKEEGKSFARDLARDVRRRVLKIPFIGVGIELRRKPKEAAA